MPKGLILYDMGPLPLHFTITPQMMEDMKWAEARRLALLSSSRPEAETTPAGETEAQTRARELHRALTIKPKYLKKRG